MSSAFTIITVYLGTQTIPDFLRVSLSHARAVHPKSRIVLLCDATSDTMQSIEVVDVQPYMRQAIDLAPLYRHASVNDAAFELACFQRWFALRDFAQSQGITSLLHIDGDVMIFATPEEIEGAFVGSDYTVSEGCSWHCAYFSNLKAIEAFCEMTKQIFERRGPVWQRTIEVIGLNQDEAHRDNLTDMLVIALIKEFYPLNFIDTSRLDARLVFDHNINSAGEGYEMADQIKSLQWVNSLPYARHLATKKFVRFGALHFQGVAKQILASLGR